MEIFRNKSRFLCNRRALVLLPFERDSIYVSSAHIGLSSYWTAQKGMIILI